MDLVPVVMCVVERITTFEELRLHDTEVIEILVLANLVDIL